MSAVDMRDLAAGASHPEHGKHASWHGVRTMASLELRLRLRAGRWRWLLASWFALLTAFMVLLRVALGRDRSGVVYSEVGVVSQTYDRPLGTPMFGGLMLFVLGVALLVVPALTAQSVNGDRERGVLASLQTTLLTPTDIAVGKFMAAWGTALVFLATSIPLLIWSMAEGGVSIGRALAAFAVVALMLGVVVAVAQCLSAVLVRSTTSAVLSYLFVFAMTLLTLVVFGLSLPATAHTVTRTEQFPVFKDFDPSNPPPDKPSAIDHYETQTYQVHETDSSKVWWLLAPNPFVILADAAPRVTPKCDPKTGARLYDPLDPLGGLGNEVRKLRVPRDKRDAIVQTGPHCPLENRGGAGIGPEPSPAADPGAQIEIYTPPPVWPWGLLFDVLLAAGALTITIHKLAAPSRKIAKGVRIA